MRNIDLSSAYNKVYENRMAAMNAGESEGKKMMRSSAPGLDHKAKGKNKPYMMKGKDGKPLFGEETEQVDEAAPLVAGLAKAAGKAAVTSAASTAASNAVNKATKPKETNEEVVLDEEEGKKDACYKKVKANSKVWPSAYASGRLVQSRKKGAGNWNTKKEELEAVFATLIDEGVAHDEESAINIITHMSDEWYQSIVTNILSEG